jgi:hypothetical protein
VDVTRKEEDREIDGWREFRMQRQTEEWKEDWMERNGD